jgi:hypothetical protein
VPAADRGLTAETCSAANLGMTLFIVFLLGRIVRRARDRNDRANIPPRFNALTPAKHGPELYCERLIGRR